MKITKKLIKEEIYKAFPNLDIEKIIITYDKFQQEWDVKIYNPVRKIGWYQFGKIHYDKFPRHMIDHLKWQIR
jgi:hypothetical protein